MSSKTILVTGANTGIGYALCKLLATEHGCAVLLGSRTRSKGEKAVAEIRALAPSASVELVEIDVSSDESVAAAAAAVREKGVTLYGLVNNAGVGLNTSGDIIETNFKGPIRVSEAFLQLIQDGGRIVNVSSGGASSWVRQQDEATKKFYSNPDISKEALEADVAKQAAGAEGGWPGTYGLSKAGLTAYTLYQAKAYPHLTCVSLSPGFIQTNMTKVSRRRPFLSSPRAIDATPLHRRDGMPRRASAPNSLPKKVVSAPCTHSSATLHRAGTTARTRSGRR